MKISPTFGFLKIVTLTCLTFALGLWYWFLLRFTTLKRAALFTLLTAIIGHVYTLSFWMHSDALFLLISTAAMVIACQINERRSHLPLRIAALALLCIAMQLVRWAGVLQWVIIAGLLVRGYPIPITLKRLAEFRAKFTAGPWIALVLSLAVTMGTFLIVRDALKLTKEQKIAAEEAGATFDEQQQPQAPIEAQTVAIVNLPKPSVKTTFTQEVLKRIREAGKWFSWLLFPELRFAGGVKILSSLDTIFGWLLIIPLCVSGWIALGKREWMWLGVGIYCVCLCLNWPNPNARYLVPLLPIVLVGIIDGVRVIFVYFGRKDWGNRLAMTLVTCVVIANVTLLAIDVRVARSHEFYGRYEGGLNQSLISCVKYLSNRGVNDGELGISEIYNNLGKRRYSKFGLRATVMLSDRTVKNVPGKWDEDDVNKARFINWTRSRHIKFYLYQRPISPWRVWHFRLPVWLQMALSREQVGPESAGWVLYRYVSPTNVVVPLPYPRVVTLAPAKWVKVDVPIVHNWPTRVPGME
jgi:hypothetical protein